MMKSFFFLFLVISITFQLALAQIDSEPMPIVYRGNTYQDVDYGNGTHTWDGGLPIRVQDDFGNYVTSIVKQSGSDVLVHTGYGSVFFDSNTCHSTFIQSDFDITKQTKQVEDERFTSKWQVMRKQGANWVEHNTDVDFSCNTGIIQNSTGNYIIQSKTNSQNSELKVTTSFVIDNPPKETAIYTHNEIAQSGSQYKFVWKMLNVNANTLSKIDSNFIREDIDLSVKQQRIIQKNEISENMIIFETVKKSFYVEWSASKNEFTSLTITNVGGIDIDFEDGSRILIIGDSISVDPTYSSDTPTKDEAYRETVDNNTCDTSPATVASGFTTIFFVTGRYSNTNTIDCSASAIQWDTSSIPDGSTITDTKFKYEVDTVETIDKNCDYRPMQLDITTASNVNVWLDILNGTAYVSNNAICTTAGTDKVIDLGTTADTNLGNALPSDRFGIGIHANAMGGVIDATSRQIFFSAQENETPQPKPTLEVTYTVNAVAIIPKFMENDGTVVTAGTITQENSTLSSTKSVNSTGQAKFTGLNGNQNFIYKETTNNFVVNKTYNYNAGAYSLFDAESRIYKVNCADSGAGTDLTIMINETDGHRISSHTTPTCSASNVIWISDIDFTANGENSNWQTSLFKILNLNTTHFGDATGITVNGTSIGSSRASSTITSDTWAIGSGLVSKNNIIVKIPLKYIPDVPTTLTATTIDSSSIILDWDAPTNTGNGTISGYKIQRETPTGNGFVTLIADTGNTLTAYTNTGLLANTQYNYRVTAINEVGTANGYSNQDSDTTSESGGVNPPAGGGGGGSGVKTDPFGTFIDLNIIAPRKLGFIGTTDTGTINIGWNTAQNVQVNLVEIDTTRLDSLSVVFQNIPVILQGDTDGTSSGKLTYLLTIPPNVCSPEIKANCVERRVYEVPIAIQSIHENRLVQSTVVLPIDITGRTDYTLFALLGIGGLAITGIVTQVVRSNKKGRQKRKR